MTHHGPENLKDKLCWNLIWQPVLAVLFIGLVLYAFSHTDASTLIWAVGAGALSASSCIVFMTPDSPIGDTKHLIGGYLIGIIIGVAAHVILIKLLPHLIQFSQHLAHYKLDYNTKAFWVLAAITIGIAMIIMALFNMMHPPAVGMSLVLVLDIQDYDIVFVIFIAVLVLAFLRYGLANYLKNMVS